MRVSKRALLVVGASAVIGLSSVAVAQTKKSTQATTMGEGEAIMVHPKGGVHKSATKVSASQHEAAMKKGARELKPGAVIYHQGGKLYLMEDNANEKASQSFQSNFDVDY
jgi:2-methylaconitate cis-trans-isomerase PrpF